MKYEKLNLSPAEKIVLYHLGKGIYLINELYDEICERKGREKYDPGFQSHFIKAVRSLKSKNLIDFQEGKEKTIRLTENGKKISEEIIKKSKTLKISEGDYIAILYSKSF
ncbi:MAG: hypothetical protein QXQ18_02140 [Candidatus Aenigmatarchaeota archaeon]